MCVISMVMDHYDPIFPREPVQPLVIPEIRPVEAAPPQTLPLAWPTPQTMQPELDQLRKLIAEFQGMVDAAKKIDTLTKQPDCEDPEKIKLLDRVAALEARIDQLERERQTHSMLQSIGKKPKKRARRKK